MQNVLILVALVAIAFVLAHWVVERLQSRFLVAAGAEYILVGVLLGPQMPWPGPFRAEMLTQVAPVMSLALGWIGLMYGMEANVRQWVRERDGAGQIALIDGLITLVGVSLICHAVLSAGLLGHFDASDVDIATWVLAASATVGSASVVELVRRRFSASGSLTDLLAHAARIGELFSIVAFGLLFCVYHPPTPGLPETWDYANWMLVTVGLGIGLGIVFRLFLGNEESMDKQFLALLGIIVFAAGAAYYLQLSPIIVCLVLGVVLANVTPDPEPIRATLRRYHRPMVILLLVFAGALWVPVGTTGIALAALYVCVRVATKLTGGWIAAINLGGVRRDVARGMLGHGEVAVAMAINYRLVHSGPVVDMVFTAILASVILSDLWSARMTRSMLLDAQEIQMGSMVHDSAVSKPQGGL